MSNVLCGVLKHDNYVHNLYVTPTTGECFIEIDNILYTVAKLSVQAPLESKVTTLTNYADYLKVDGIILAKNTVIKLLDNMAYYCKSSDVGNPYATIDFYVTNYTV